MVSPSAKSDGSLSVPRPDQLGFVGYGEGKLAAEIDIVDGQSLHQPIVPADFPDGGIKSLRFVSGGNSVIREIAGLRRRMLPSEPISGKSAGGSGEQQDAARQTILIPFFMTVPPCLFGALYHNRSMGASGAGTGGLY